MVKTRFSMALCFFLMTLAGMAQTQSTGVLLGKVTDAHNPVIQATIQVKGQPLGVATDVYGKFVLKGVPIGKQTFIIRAVGYQQEEQTINISSGENQPIEISLKEDQLGLEEVVVSATRYNLSRKEAPVIVNVVSPKLFNATQSMSLSEGLDYQPGVRVETNCQNCGFTQVRLNGLEGAYSQILINSRAVFSAMNAVYGLDQIPANMIERVEVVRSGGSALFGSNAIAGTINIITRDPVINSWQIGTNYSLIDGKVPDKTVNFDGSLVSEDLSRGLTVYGMGRNRNAFDANDDGFSEITRMQNLSIGTKAFLKPGENSKITVDFSALEEYRRGGDRLDMVPHLTDITEELNHQVYLGGITYDAYSADQANQYSVYLSGQHSGRQSYYGGLGGGRTAQDSLFARHAYGQTTARSWVGGFQYNHHFGGGDVLTSGIEYHADDVQDDIPGYQRTIHQQVGSLGWYAQYEWKVAEDLTTLLGGRYDLVSVNGLYQIADLSRRSIGNTGVFSPRLTLLYDIYKNLQFRGGYARGFRAPQAFNEDMHISSVGGEPQFIILSEDLQTEYSNAYTASFSFTPTYRQYQVSLLVEGFYTDLKRPFTSVNTGSTLTNGSILHEVRNGKGAYVMGTNTELSISPSPDFTFQLGGTLQKSRYRSAQTLYEPQTPSENESVVSTEKFVRTPQVYGYLTTHWDPTGHLYFDVTGTFTGSMIAPHVTTASGYPELVQTPEFAEINLRAAYTIKASKQLHIEVSTGVQNLLNSYQQDFDRGPLRDSDYIYGPSQPRTIFLGVKIGNFQIHQ